MRGLLPLVALACLYGCGSSGFFQGVPCGFNSCCGPSFNNWGSGGGGWGGWDGGCRSCGSFYNSCNAFGCRSCGSYCNTCGPCGPNSCNRFYRIGNTIC